eukprot:1092806-Pleurochrysis_carterae.AAC.1
MGCVEHARSCGTQRSGHGRSILQALAPAYHPPLAASVPFKRLLREAHHEVESVCALCHETNFRN